MTTTNRDIRAAHCKRKMEAYLRKENVSLVDFFNMILVPPPTWYRILMGKDIFLSAARKIVAATGGDVEFSDLAGCYDHPLPTTKQMIELKKSSVRISRTKHLNSIADDIFGEDPIVP